MKKLVQVILKSLVFFAAWAALVGVIPVPTCKEPAVWRFWAECIPFGCIVLINLSFWLIEKRKIPVFTLRKPGRCMAAGFLAGLVWLAVPVMILTAAGVLHLERGEPVSMLWLWLLSVLLNAAMQELLVRGYLYRLIRDKYHAAAAAAVTTALFTLMHGGILEAGPVPVLNVLTMSLLMTLVLEYTGSLLTPVIMHFLWNSIGAVLLGGVCLAEDYPHVFHAVFAGEAWLSGGAYKLEGSAAVLAVNLLLIAWFGAKTWKEKKHENHSGNRR